jgi:DGQHR domain-containing protein
VVDGQHRIAGIHEAYDKSGSELEYDVPVVATLGIQREDEMRLFHIVNSKAKSVPTDLAAELLRQAILSRGRSKTVHTGKLSEKDFRKAVGAQVARHLNSSPGPWAGKIRLPNEERDVKRKPMQLNAIASSLEPLLRDRFITSQTEREVNEQWPTLSGWVYNYWSALQVLMPEAFNSIEEYTLQRTAGLYAFHMTLPDVLDRCRARNSFTVETMVDILKPLGPWVESGTWHREYGDPITRSTGMASIRVLAEEMRKGLAPLAVD